MEIIFKNGSVIKGIGNTTNSIRGVSSRYIFWQGGEEMKSFLENIYVHRNKEENWELEKRADNLGFSNAKDLLYVGYEVGFLVEFFEDGTNKVLAINGVDVTDKNISL